MQYRRATIKGGTNFFTVNLSELHLQLLVDYVDILRDASQTGEAAPSFLH